MGAFYGGIAHVPLSALVLVCELAGTYDLLVPLMLSLAIAYVALRKRTLYDAQLSTQHESPVHRDSMFRSAFTGVCVRDVMSHRLHVSFAPTTPAAEMLRLSAEVPWQDVFPVIDTERRMVGLVGSPALRLLAMEAEDSRWALAADIMQGPVTVRPEDDLSTATRELLANGLREIAVVDRDRQLLGVLDEVQIAEAYVRAVVRDDGS
jgi:CIC family chloride channel protein